jgi:hypothetical protein
MLSNQSLHLTANLQRQLCNRFASHHFGSHAFFARSLAAGESQW